MRVLLYFITICILLVSPSILSSQIVSNGNDLTDYYPPAFTQPIITSHNPGSEWPDCTEPKDITVAEDRDNYIISWDGDERLSSKYYYEISIDDDSRSDENTTSFKNIYKISKSSFGRSGKDQIKIRRICYAGMDKKFYSNWVTQTFAALSVTCIGGQISGGGYFCTTSTRTAFQSVSPGSGGPYRWEYKNPNSSNWTTIPQAVNEDLESNYILTSPPAIRQYRRFSECNEVSNTIIDTVSSNSSFINNLTLSQCANNNFFVGFNFISTGYIGPVNILYDNTYWHNFNFINANGSYGLAGDRSADGNNHTISFNGSQCFTQFDTTITAPQPCNCSISNIVVSSPINCFANGYSLPFSCQVNNATTNQQLTAYVGNVSTTVNIVNGTASGILNNLPYGTGNATLFLSTINGTPNCYDDISFVRPSSYSQCSPISCSITNINLSAPTNCSNTTFNLPFSCNIQNASGQSLNVSIGQQSVILTVPPNGVVSGVLQNIPYNTPGSVLFSIDNGSLQCEETETFTSPSSGADCNPTYCGVNYIGGYCNGSNYFVTGSIVVNNPVPGSTVYVTDSPSGRNVAIPMVAGTNIYNFDITNITPDGAVHTLTMNGTPCGSVTPSTQYNAPAACTGAANCLLGDFNASSGPCDPTTNQFTVSGSFTIDCSEPDLFTISIPDHGKQILIPTTPGQTTYPFSFPGLPANGASFQLLFTSQLNGSGPVMLTAPQSCTNTPTSKCGDPYTLPPPPTEDLLDRSNPGDIFTVAGIPFQVTAVSGSNGIFSGEGRLVTPFSSTRLKVTFTGIEVTTNYKVKSGTVLGASSTLNLKNYLKVDTFSIGGDICIIDPPPPGTDPDGFDEVTGYNDRGFGRDSLFYPDSTKYDRQGFDYNGISRDNGTPYNDLGCDMNGLNRDSLPCNPDSTLVKLQDSIFTIIHPGITSTTTGGLLNTLKDSLASFDCQAIRNVMDTKISALAYNAKYIKGSNGEYFNKGMSANFSQEPQPLLNNSGRKADAIELEKKHIELYKCDILSDQLEKMIKYLENIDTADFRKYISSELSKLDKTKLQELADSADARIAWVKEIIVQYLQTKGSGPGFGAVIENEPLDLGLRKYPSSKVNGSIPTKRSYSSEYFSMASATDEQFQFEPAPGQEESWLYNQGFKNINGIDRAYYVEAAYKQMQQNLLLNGNTNTDEILQPILLNKDSAGLSYNIYLDNIRLTPQGALLDAYFVFKVPQAKDKSLVMKALNLGWGSGGIIGESRLYLGSAIEIRLTNSAMLRLNAQSPTGQGGTYVAWDCKGFKAIGIDGDVEVCRDMIVPLDANLEPLEEPARFGANIRMEFRSWSDLYFEVNANKAFAIAGYEKYKWELEGLVVDMSDHRSPASTPMFNGFTSKFYKNGSFDKEWRGFYLKKLTATFPNGFSKDSLKKITATLEQFVIDDMGASGLVSASNLVDIEDGNLGGWPFSIDTARVIVSHNHIVGGGLSGQVKVPVFKDAMRYGAMMFPGNKYQFTLEPTRDQEMNMVLAKVTLDSTSSVKILYDNGKVVAEARLTGDIEVGKLGNDENGLSLPSAHFVGLTVRNTEPYFNAGKWSVTGSLKGQYAGFEIGIDSIRAYNKSETEGALSFKVGVAFPCNLSAFGGLEVVGVLSSDDKGRQKWIHKQTNLNSFGIDASFSAGHVKGYLETFRGDGVYGRGYQGLVGMKFNAIGELKAMALFGNKGFKYFFIDAEATLNTGIPAGPLEINGFIGGVSYKMDVEASTTPYTGAGLPSLGNSFSGNKYTPDTKFKLGFRAGIKMRMAKNPKIFNGQVVFEMQFVDERPDGSGGGIGKITLDGKGQMMANLPISGKLIEGKEGAAKPTGVDASLSAHIRFQYNNSLRTFTGMIRAYMNAGILTGVGTGGKMVDANIYVGPDKWYFHYGTPSNPCGLKLGDIATLQSYLCIGTEIPGLPAIPSDVQALAGNIKPNAALVNNGSGFLFGANFEAKAKLNFWVGKAEMKAKAGFDIMVRDFGEGASCAGRSGGLGINGWYGVGQLWALIEGKLKIAGFTIFDAGIAGILQAQMPNPFFAQASLGARVKTLFGTQQKTIKIKLGEECEIDYGPNGSSLGMKIVSSLSPGHQGKKMPVDAEPLATLNLPLETDFELGNDKYLVKKSTSSIVSLKTGYNYPFKEELNEEKTLLELKMSNVFNANDSIRMFVKVDIFKNGTLQESEIDSAIFTTDIGYKTIPTANIESSYPIDGMANYYKDESNQYKGFIQLKSGMPELFYNLPDGVSQKIRLTKQGGSSVVYDYTYQGLSGRLEFPMDPAMLDNDGIYTLDVVRFKTGAYPTATPSKGISVADQSAGLNFGSVLGVNNNSSAPSDEAVGETVIASIQFRVSKYNTFLQKISQATKVQSTPTTPTSFKVQNENFDKAENDILMEMELVENTWLKKYKTNMYEYFPKELIYVSSMSSSGLGNCFPKLDIYKHGAYDALSEKFGFLNVPSGYFNFNTISSTSGHIYCDVQKGVIEDYYVMQNLIRSRFGYSACVHDLGSGKIPQFNANHLRPVGLKFFFDDAHTPASNQSVEIILKYNIPGLGTTSTTKLTY